MPNHVFFKSCGVHNAVRIADMTEWGIFPGHIPKNVEPWQKFCLPPHAAGMRQASASKKNLSKKASVSSSPSSDDKGRGRQSFPISYGG